MKYLTQLMHWLNRTSAQDDFLARAVDSADLERRIRYLDTRHAPLIYPGQ